jgi:hypothetical protein
MKLFLLLVLLICLSATPLAMAFADTALKAEIDKSAIATDELLTYKLVLSSTEKDIPSPKLPDFKDWVIVSQAQSSSVSFQKGGLQSVLVYAFILMPKKAGKIKIEPAGLVFKSKTYSSEAFEIQVKQGAVRLPKEPEPQIPDSGQPKYSL